MIPVGHTSITVPCYTFLEEAVKLIIAGWGSALTGTPFKHYAASCVLRSVAADVEPLDPDRFTGVLFYVFSCRSENSKGQTP